MTEEKALFSKRETNFCKGIAILLMLFHHLFNDYDEYAGFAVSYWPFTGEQITRWALLSKLCVAIFVILSGYGLTATWDRQFGEQELPAGRETWNFVWQRLWKLMTGYWFWFLVVLLCQPLGRTMASAYGKVGVKATVVYFVIDFLGLSYLFSTPTLNPTWWYLSVAIAIIVLLPFLLRAMRRMGAPLCAAALLLTIYGLRLYNDFTFYAPSLLLGILCYECRVFARADRLAQKHPLLVPLAEAAALFALLKLRMDYNFNGLVDGLLAGDLLLLTHTFLIRIPLLAAGLELFGRHSADIFLIHNPIYSFYFPAFFYSCRHWALIVAVLAAVCLLLSSAAQWLQKKTRFREWMEKAGRFGLYG